MSKFEVIRGVEGCCLALDDTRIAGPKPWGGGTVIHAWETNKEYKAVNTGTLTAEQVRECVQHVYYEGYSDGYVHKASGIEETDWQAIADELNATLGGGECRIAWRDESADTADGREHDGAYFCTGCGKDLPYPLQEMWDDYQALVRDYGNKQPWNEEPFTHCPNCGKAVKR